MKILYFILLLPSLLSAQGFEFDRRLVLPRSLSLAGCTDARIAMNESIYQNPASSAQTRIFSAEYNYGWNYVPGIPERMDNYSFSALDTSSEFFGGGLAITDHSIRGIGTEWDFRGILNRSLWDNRLGLGIGIDYAKIRRFDVRDSNFNLDLGALFLATKGLIFGATAYNILNDKKNNIFTSSIALASRYTFWDFFAVDLEFIHKIDKKYSLAGALETLYKSGLMFNLSVMKDQQYGNTLWGGGIGFVAPKVSFIYGTLNSITPPWSFRHALSFRFFM
jgi:hypothetical protein